MKVRDAVAALLGCDQDADIYLSNAHADNMPHPGALTEVEQSVWSVDRNEPVGEGYELPGENLTKGVILWGDDVAGILKVPGT